MIILYVVACSACFSFGAIFMAIFCVAGRSDEQALIDEIDRLKMELAWHTHTQQQRQGSMVAHAARIAAVARGDA